MMSNMQISNYVRGKIWEILIVWGVSYGIFALFELKFALLISFFVGLSVLIPYIGATILVLPVALVAFFSMGPGPQKPPTLWGYTVSSRPWTATFWLPSFCPRWWGLHPVAIIVSFIDFWWFLGVLGTLSGHSPGDTCPCSHQGVEKRRGRT